MYPVSGEGLSLGAGEAITAEVLYLLLADEFELRERQLALERKLAVVNTTVETLLELSHVGRSLRVEWYIVILIVFEILLTLFTMAFLD